MNIHYLRRFIKQLMEQIDNLNNVLTNNIATEGLITVLFNEDIQKIVSIYTPLETTIESLVDEMDFSPPLRESIDGFCSLTVKLRNLLSEGSFQEDLLTNIQQIYEKYNVLKKYL
ncbi:hypothetical protein ABD87_14905 [Lysinibacillus sphaericus]|uniref:hypothetical protein n=1 Tax=Lysinibacillus sphaericus TaxID=1421 RepID=UPI0018CD5792|nr:hypothetical protein [Lysinibacillus sphaericus]MBG9730783.1 hypothetical protein [Lysinibacillus sphaericus]